MTAKEFLHRKGITNNPGKGLFVLRGDQQFDIAALMEEFAKQNLKNVNTPSECLQIESGNTLTPFAYGMHDGYFWNSRYYPLTEPVPKAMDREYAIMTTSGPTRVYKGDSVIKNTKGEVTGIQRA